VKESLGVCMATFEASRGRGEQERGTTVKIFTLCFAIGAALLVSIGAVSAQQHVVKIAYGVNNPPTQFIESTKIYNSPAKS
jgi:hypothetical protein